MRMTSGAATTALNALGALYNSGTLVFYTGMMPRTASTGINDVGANTALLTFTFASTAFEAPVQDATPYMKTQASFTTNPVTPNANGVAAFARSYNSGGGNIEDRVVGQVWAAGMTVALGQFVMASGNTYICTGAGTTASSGSGPSGLGASIADGTALWQLMNIGAPDILLESTTLSTATPVNLPYFWLALPGQ